MQADLDVNAAKKKLRVEMQAMRQELSPEEKGRLSQLVQNNIMSSPQWKKARAITLFVSMPDEVETDNLLQNAWKDGKTVLLPKVVSKKEGRMRFVACNGMSDLREGAFGIMEPGTEACARAESTIVPDMMLIPGLAFDGMGHRLGYGGGFYDRFLAAHQNWTSPRVALGFSFQLVDKVPFDQYDFPLDAVCRENGWLWF